MPVQTNLGLQFIDTYDKRQGWTGTQHAEATLGILEWVQLRLVQFNV